MGRGQGWGAREGWWWEEETGRPWERKVQGECFLALKGKETRR